MTHPITLTATLAVEPGKADAAEAAKARVAEAVASADDLALTATWDGGGSILTLGVGAASQAAVDRHLADHGPLYAGFDGIATVTKVRVAGPVDDETIAAMRRLADVVETA